MKCRGASRPASVASPPSEAKQTFVLRPRAGCAAGAGPGWRLAPSLLRGLSAPVALTTEGISAEVGRGTGQTPYVSPKS